MNSNADFENAVKAAVKILSYHDLSEIELVERLLDKNIDSETAADVLSYLIEKKWYNQTKSAQALVKSKLRGSFCGYDFLSRFLKSRQFPDDVVEDVLNNVFVDGFEFGLAQKTTDKEIKKLKRKFLNKPYAEQKIRYSLKNLLLRRGFSENICDEIIENLGATEYNVDEI